MPTFGVHAFVWNGDWNNQIAPETIRLSAAAGFDMMEIPLLKPAETDGPLLRRLLEQNHIWAATSLALPKDLHLPFYPEKALDFLKVAIDVTEQIGSPSLSGCPYCNLGTLTGLPPTEAERDSVAYVFTELARYAKAKNIRVGIEPVNRYETYLYNVGADVVALIERIGADNLFVHFDTYHMHIEEQGLANAFKQAGAHTGYIHMSESDRGIPGKGNVNWDDACIGLKAINFRGPLVLEAFAAINPDLAAATCLWRPGSYTAQELADQGLAFLRAKAAQHGLQ